MFFVKHPKRELPTLIWKTPFSTLVTPSRRFHKMNILWSNNFFVAVYGELQDFWRSEAHPKSIKIRILFVCPRALFVFVLILIFITVHSQLRPIVMQSLDTRRGRHLLKTTPWRMSSENVLSMTHNEKTNCTQDFKVNFCFC